MSREERQKGGKFPEKENNRERQELEGTEDRGGAQGGQEGDIFKKQAK